MRLTSEQVKKVAKLANLPLNTKEEERYSEQLSNILSYIEQLNGVDTSNIEPIFNITANSNVMRKDETGECLSQEQALSNAKNKKNGFFVTKGVFEE